MYFNKEKNYKDVSVKKKDAPENQNEKKNYLYFHKDAFF